MTTKKGVHWHGSVIDNEDKNSFEARPSPSQNLEMFPQSQGQSMSSKSIANKATSATRQPGSSLYVPASQDLQLFPQSQGGSMSYNVNKATYASWQPTSSLEAPVGNTSGLVRQANGGRSNKSSKTNGASNKSAYSSLSRLTRQSMTSVPPAVPDPPNYYGTSQLYPYPTIRPRQGPPTNASSAVTPHAYRRIMSMSLEEHKDIALASLQRVSLQGRPLPETVEECHDSE